MSKFLKTATLASAVVLIGACSLCGCVTNTAGGETFIGANPMQGIEQMAIKVGIPDLRAALADTPPSDPDASQCYSFLINYVQTQTTAAPGTGVKGVFSTIQVLRNANANASNLRVTLQPVTSACGAWFLENQADIIHDAADLGIAIKI